MSTVNYKVDKRKQQLLNKIRQKSRDSERKKEKVLSRKNSNEIKIFNDNERVLDRQYYHNKITDLKENGFQQKKKHFIGKGNN